MSSYEASGLVSDNFDDVAERDPSGRYLRSDEILEEGASKIVYKAFDELNGIEVAWNKVKIDETTNSPEQLERLSLEVHILKSLKHENIIKCYHSWVDHANKTVNMITELFTSGTLRSYRKKHRKVDLKAIKNWAMQVLRGLMHLHSHYKFRIIHGNLKCDNIFVNGNAGQIKIGDLSVAVGNGTPELYDEECNELIDIYSFGLCMLEMVTCENQDQVFKNVTSSIKPASLGKVSDPRVKQFIEKCLVPAPMRPSAAELLNDPFLMDTHNVVSSELKSFNLMGKKEDDSSISMKLRIVDLFGEVKNINFLFYPLTDTSRSIADEMVVELNLTKEDVVVVSELMDDLIKRLVSARESVTLEVSTISNSSCSALSDGFSTSPAPTLRDNGKCDELMMELAAIDFQYQQLVAELMERKADAIEDAKRKWVSSGGRAIDDSNVK